MAYQMILYNIKDGVAIITLNTPEKLNSLDYDTVDELTSVILEAGADDSVGAIVLTGAGRSFCAGGDVKEMLTGYTTVGAYKQMGKYHRMSSEISNVKKPVIGAINGLAVGGGFALAILCDILIAAEDTKFRFIFKNVSLVPDLGVIYYLTKMLGAQKMKELVFTDKLILAEEACRLGFVSKVVAPDKLMEEAFQLAKNLAAGPRVMLQYTKKMINMASENSIATMLEMEARAQTELFQTEDHKIAVKAFINKEKPVFIGK